MKIEDLKNDGNKPAEVVEDKPRDMKGMTFKTVNVHNRDNVARSEVNMTDILPEPKTGEFPGVTIKESLVNDILGPGGPFEEYKKRKMEEYRKFIAEQKAEAELEGKKIVDGGVDLKPIIPVEDLEQAEVEGTKSNIIQMHPEQQRQNSDPNFVFKMQEDDIFD